MLLNTEETYRKLQSFNSIGELNETIKLIRDQFRDQLNKTDLNVLDALSRYSCVYFGLSFRSKSNIADELGISRRTVIRACNRLEELGIIKQHELKRHNGDRRRSSNAIVILPCHNEVSQQETLPKPKKINNTIDTEKAVFEDKETVIKNGLKVKLPQVLQRALSPFFNVDELYSLVGIVYKAKASVDKSIELESHEQDYYNAIISVINAYKRGKVKNLPALIYHAVKNTTRNIKANAQVSLFLELTGEQ